MIRRSVSIMSDKTKGRLNITNRDTYKCFQNSPIIPYYMDRKIKSVKLKMVSHDELYEEQKKKGIQIDITSSDILVNGKKPLNGIFSPLFGADTTQDIPIYSCDCRKLTGGVNLGKTCPECGTKCRSIEANLTICGYVDIAPYHILTFHGYNAFLKLFGKDIINDIITSTKKINVKGKIIEDGKETLITLYDNYNEKYYSYIGIEKKYLFTSKIPVYSARLRPLIHSRVHMAMLDVNQAYLSIVNNRNILISSNVFRLKRDLEVQQTLNEIQQQFLTIIDIVEGQIDEKNGVFRKSLAAGRLDYSARLVITLDTTLKPHEVSVPYSLMMVLYEEEIANYLSRMTNVSLSKAIDIIEENYTNVEPRLARIINHFLKSKDGLLTDYREGDQTKNSGVWCLINRNPTISESSILYMRIRNIHDDPDDYTLHLAPDILGLLAADFDGDQCTLIATKDREFHKYFLNMCPTYTFIDRANGKYNKAMDFKKDYAALITYMWELDRSCDRYLNNPDESSYNTLVDYGINPNEVEEEDQEKREELLRAITTKLDKSHPFRKRYVDDYYLPEEKTKK